MNAITMYDGTPIGRAFPFWTAPEDEFAMTMTCQSALGQWRAAVAHHKELVTVNEKLAYRKFLERAFEALKVAWASVNEPMYAAAA